MKRSSLALFLVVLTLAGCGGPDRTAGPNRDAGLAIRRPNADSILGKNAAFSCIEQGSMKNLPKAQWAFDGTVTDLVPPKDEHGEENPEDIFAKITFRVNHWYKGNLGETVTLLADYAPIGVSSVEEVETPIGARILGSGVDNHLWSCGFSKVYTPKNAQLFEEAFSST